MSIRRAASCAQPRHDSSVPRGARTILAPGRAPVWAVIARVYAGRGPSRVRSPDDADPCRPPLGGPANGRAGAACSPGRRRRCSSRRSSLRSRRSSPTSDRAATPPSSTPPNGSMGSAWPPIDWPCARTRSRRPTRRSRPRCWPGSARRSPTAAGSTRRSSLRRRPIGSARSGRASSSASDSRRSRAPACSSRPARPAIRPSCARSGPRRWSPASRPLSSSCRRSPARQTGPWIRRPWPWRASWASTGCSGRTDRRRSPRSRSGPSPCPRS